MTPTTPAPSNEFFGLAFPVICDNLDHTNAATPMAKIREVTKADMTLLY